MHPILLNGDVEILTSIASTNILNFSIAFLSDLSKDAVNYTTIQLINKGIDGLGEEILAEINTNSGDEDSINIAKYNEYMFFNLTVELDKSFIILQKVDTGGVLDLGYALVMNCCG